MFPVASFALIVILVSGELVGVISHKPPGEKTAKEQLPGDKLAGGQFPREQIRGELLPRDQPGEQRSGAPRELNHREQLRREQHPRDPLQIDPLSIDPLPRDPLPRDPLRREQFPTDPLPREQFPREQLPREQFPREHHPRDPLPRDPLPRDPLPRERFPTDPHPREQFPREQLPREQLPREQLPREQLPREQLPIDPLPGDPLPRDPLPREQFPTDPLPREQFPSEQLPREQFPREQHPRVPLPTDPLPREQFPRDQHPREEFPREQLPREQFPIQQLPRDQFPREQLPREQFPREQHPREQFPREQRPREHFPREHLPREQIPREQLQREQFSREQLPRELIPRKQLPRPQLLSEQFLGEQFPRERLPREQFPREQLPREQLHREQFPREQLHREQHTGDLPRGKPPTEHLPAGLLLQGTQRTDTAEAQLLTQNQGGVFDPTTHLRDISAEIKRLQTIEKGLIKQKEEMSRLKNRMHPHLNTQPTIDPLLDALGIKDPVIQETAISYKPLDAPANVASNQAPPAVDINSSLKIQPKDEQTRLSVKTLAIEPAPEAVDKTGQVGQHSYQSENGQLMGVQQNQNDALITERKSRVGGDTLHSSVLSGNDMQLLGLGDRGTSGPGPAGETGNRPLAAAPPTVTLPTVGVDYSGRNTAVDKRALGLSGGRNSGLVFMDSDPGKRPRTPNQQQIEQRKLTLRIQSQVENTRRNLDPDQQPVKQRVNNFGIRTQLEKAQPAVNTQNSVEEQRQHNLGIRAQLEKAQTLNNQKSIDQGQRLGSRRHIGTGQQIQGMMNPTRQEQHNVGMPAALGQGQPPLTAELPPSGSVNSGIMGTLTADGFFFPELHSSGGLLGTGDSATGTDSVAASGSLVRARRPLAGTSNFVSSGRLGTLSADPFGFLGLRGTGDVGLGFGNEGTEMLSSTTFNVPDMLGGLPSTVTTGGLFGRSVRRNVASDPLLMPTLGREEMGELSLLGMGGWTTNVDRTLGMGVRTPSVDRTTRLTGPSNILRNRLQTPGIQSETGSGGLGLGLGSANPEIESLINSLIIRALTNTLRNRNLSVNRGDSTLLGSASGGLSAGRRSGLSTLLGSPGSGLSTGRSSGLSSLVGNIAGLNNQENTLGGIGAEELLERLLMQ